MVNRLGPNFTWHFTNENDREWLKQTLTDFSPSVAISMNDNLDLTAERSRFSRIASNNDGDRILWVAQRLIRPTLTITAIAIHPKFRKQNYIRRIAEEEFAWIKREWNIKYLEWPTKLEHITGANLFGFEAIQLEDSILTKVRLNDITTI